MKVSNIAAQKLLDELIKSKVVVTIADISYRGIPDIDFYNKTFSIQEVEPIGELGILTIFDPFSIEINDSFKSPVEFPFDPDPNYKAHIEKLRNEVIIEIDNNIKLRIGKWDILDYLFDLEFHLKEIIYNFQMIDDIGYENSFPTESDNFKTYINKNIRIEIKGKSVEFTDSRWRHFCLSRYWDIQLSTINKLLQIIEPRKKVIEITDDYVKVLNVMSPQQVLQWKKSDTDLLELIVALNESGSIFCNNSAMTRKQTIEFFENLFGKTIKDSESKLSKATDRKRDLAPFLTFLKQTFENYSKNKL